VTTKEPEEEISEKVWRYGTPLERVFLLSNEVGENTGTDFNALNI
jgi:hypothetical protein